MSEAEIKRRYDYKQNRKKWIIIQTVAIVIAVIIALGSFLTYNRMNQTYYIEYTESGSVDYKVQYKENDFFKEEWVGSGQSYVSEIVNGISADFIYDLNMDTANVGFDYTYDIVAKLIVADKTTGDHIYAPTDTLLPKVTESVSGLNSFEISKNVFVDFNKYNNEAQTFVNVYNLKNAKTSLVVTMNVAVLSSSDAFEENNSNTYTISLNIPLLENNFSINTSSAVAEEESKVLACKGAMNQDIFKNASIASLIVALLLACVLAIFVNVTKNEDVNYTIKVQRLVRAYRSFIQQINGDFDVSGYQTVPIKTFVEMLGIRDTIQSPILMSENRDQTKTQFLIPTNTKLLYVFEIKVDNYDEIYNKIAEENNSGTENEFPPQTQDAVVTDTAHEETILPEQIFEASNSEALDSYVESEDGDTLDSVVYYDENNNKLSIKCRRSCLANIIQSENESAKAYYSELKNHILSFKGVKSRMSWRFESFNKGRRQLLKLKIRGKTICLFCALDPNEFETSKYFHESVKSKNFEQVPMLIRIRSARALNRAKKLVDILMERNGIVADPKYKATDYVSEHPYERTQELIDRGLIKILVPDGYIVVDPHHIVSSKALPNEDISGTDSVSEIDDTLDSVIYYDENNNKLSIKCRRSCLANIIQSENEGAKAYYSELKNYILSFKGVKSRMSWRFESFNKGRRQLLKLKIRGKTIFLFCALDPNEFETSKYFHESVKSKNFEQVPMLIRIRSARALNRAKKLVDILMERNGIVANPKYKATDYVSEHPYKHTNELVDVGLIKIL